MDIPILFMVIRPGLGQEKEKPSEGLSTSTANYLCRRHTGEGDNQIRTVKIDIAQECTAISGAKLSNFLIMPATLPTTTLSVKSHKYGMNSDDRNFGFILEPV